MRQLWRRTLLITVLSALLISLVIVLSESDLAEIIYWTVLLLLFPRNSPCYLHTAAPQERPACGIPLGFRGGLFACKSFHLLEDHEIRTPARWLAHSRTYKADLLAQPVLASGGLKHTEWDNSGFAGIGDTEWYLIYDSQDRLRRGRRGQYGVAADGLPGKVIYTHRLEQDGYVVQFSLTRIGIVAERQRCQSFRSRCLIACEIVHRFMRD